MGADYHQCNRTHELIKAAILSAKEIKPSRNMALVITKLEEAEDRILRASVED